MSAVFHIAKEDTIVFIPENIAVIEGIKTQRILRPYSVAVHGGVQTVIFKGADAGIILGQVDNLQLLVLCFSRARWQSGYKIGKCFVVDFVHTGLLYFPVVLLNNAIFITLWYKSLNCSLSYFGRIAFKTSKVPSETLSLIIVSKLYLSICVFTSSRSIFT